jgi:hypothetical protein
MTTFLDSLRAAPTTPVAEWNIFIIDYSPRGDRVFVFHEGRDDPAFYRAHLRAVVPDRFEIRFVRAGNKAAVLFRLTEFLARFSPNPRAIFLVDKDHDDVTATARPTYDWLYTTSLYSIENFLCTPDVVRGWCVDVAGISDMDDRCTMISARYAASRLRFVEIMKPVMAWILCARRLGYPLNLNNVDAGQFVAINDELLPVQSRPLDEICDYLARVTGGSTPNAPIDPALLAAEAASLGDVDSRRWLRGKQDAWFLARFLDAIVNHAREGGSLIKPRAQVAPANVLVVLGPSVQRPSCLAGFLDRVATALAGMVAPQDALLE